jgi:hypothetical protein
MQKVRRKLIDSGRIAGAKANGRSSVSNGNKTLPDTDGRLRIARRYRDVASAILADQGGVDFCSESRRQLIRRFAAFAVVQNLMRR